MTSLSASLLPYLRPGPLAVFALGISSGFPIALILATLTLWLSELGISKGTIGLFAAVTTPYSLKFAWAPFVQNVRLPLFARWVGHRRAWLFLTQGLLFLAIIALGLSAPAQHISRTALFAVAVGFLSATQDIIIDAYRIEILDGRDQPAGASMITTGYRFGMLFSGAGTLLLAQSFNWPTAYVITAFLVSVGALAAVLIGEPDLPQVTKGQRGQSFLAWAWTTFLSPVVEFSRSQGLKVALLILAFLVLLKLGDAMAAIMTSPLLVDLGFTKPEIASANKLVGAAAGILGAAAAALTVNLLGMRSALFATSVFMMLSNLLFVALAQVGHSIPMLALTIGVENFSSALGGTVLVAYLSGLCDLRFTATQYALLSALTNVARAVLATPSGFVQEAVGWPVFFCISTAAALPGLLLLWLLIRSGGVAEVRQ